MCKISLLARGNLIVWWMGVDYELISWTLCTRTTREKRSWSSLIYTNQHTNPWVSTCVHTLAKKAVLAAFLIIIHQTIILCQYNVISMTSGYFSIFVTRGYPSR